MSIESASENNKKPSSGQIKIIKIQIFTQICIFLYSWHFFLGNAVGERLVKNCLIR